MNRRSGWIALVIGALTVTIPTFLLFRAVTFLFLVPFVLGIVCVLLGIASLRTEMTISKYVGCIAAILMLIAVLVPFGTIAYYNRTGYPIVIVVPSGFRGPIWIVEDSQAEEIIPKVDGEYRVKVPQSGVLRVKSTDMFAVWHSETSRYSDGKILPHDGPIEVPDNVLCLRDGGYVAATRSGQELRFMAYYVGTRLEAKQFLETPSDPPE
ncbi:MAG TPA: hypothetical protein VMF69_19300 [Gemmataceae bacterium]|nr:hypothetical protein [Gemmataceae bacterium]